jgi:MFS family permease
MSGVLFLVFAASGAVSPLTANYVRSLGAGTAEIGLLLAVVQASALASQYWWGRVSDRLGRRKPLVAAGVGGLALAYLAWAGVSNYGWLVPARVLEGLAFAAYSTSALALVGDLLEGDEQRGRLMGAYRMVGSLAFAGAALGGGLLADALGLRVPLLAAAGCYGLALLLVAGVREPRHESLSSNHAANPATIVPTTQTTALSVERLGVGNRSTLNAQRGNAQRTNAQRSLLSFLAVSFAWFFGMGSVVALWPVHMQSLGYTQTAIGGLWALAALGEVPCLPLAGALADRFGRMRVIVGGTIAMACVYLAYTASAALLWLVAVQLFRSLAYASYETPALTLATELGVRAQRGRTVGLYQTVSSAAGIAGAVAGGALAEALGLPQMFRLVALLMLVVAIGAAWSAVRHARQHAAAPQGV